MEHTFTGIFEFWKPWKPASIGKAGVWRSTAQQTPIQDRRSSAGMSPHSRRHDIVFRHPASVGQVNLNSTYLLMKVGRLGVQPSTWKCPSRSCL